MPDLNFSFDRPLGYVVEAKKSLPANTDFWKKIVDQLYKYDDDLIGWWTDNERIANSCVLLLLHASRASDFKFYLNNLIIEGHKNFEHPISIIEFIRSSEVKEFIFLRKHWGQIDDEAIDKKLISGVNIPTEAILVGLGKRKFYDSSPITEYMMIVLWQDIFADLKSISEYDEKNKAWIFEVNIDDLTVELQSLFGQKSTSPRDVSFPKVDWVREAMTAFEKLDLAQKTGSNNIYRVVYKQIKGNIFEKFTQHRKDNKKKQTRTLTQLQLFEIPEQQSPSQR